MPFPITAPHIFIDLCVNKALLYTLSCFTLSWKTLYIFLLDSPFTDMEKGVQRS